RAAGGRADTPRSAEPGNGPVSPRPDAATAGTADAVRRVADARPGVHAAAHGRVRLPRSGGGGNARRHRPAAGAPRHAGNLGNGARLAAVVGVEAGARARLSVRSAFGVSL